jgi:hypothetical protein
MHSPIAQPDAEKKINIKTAFIIACFTYLIITYTLSLSAFVSPSQERRWDTSIEPLAYPTYQRTTSVSITGLLEQGTQFIDDGEYFSFTNPETIIWAIIILDPNNVPVHFTRNQIIDAQGDQTLSLITYSIPPDATLGVYKIRLIVLTELLPTGDLRTNFIHETTFEVTA